MTRQERYSRQVLFGPIGAEGQEKLRRGFVVIVGCGALGSGAAMNLGRAGVGRLRLVDRDVLDITNLHRQNLFTEADAAERLPKAVAAARRLKEINGEIDVDPRVADVTFRNVLDLIEGAHVVVDGTDNVETRYLLNDACVRTGRPWVYGGAVGAQGMCLTVIPGDTACLRCVFEEPPPPGALPTCDTIGVINTVTAIVSALQSAEVMKLLLGSREVNRDLVQVDAWKGEWRRTSVRRRPDCAACGLGRFEFLEGRAASHSSSLCGRNAVHFSPAADVEIDLARLKERLSRVGEAKDNGFLLTARVEGFQLTIFPQGRVLVEGTSDLALARSLVSKYVGI